MFLGNGEETPEILSYFFYDATYCVRLPERCRIWKTPLYRRFQLFSGPLRLVPPRSCSRGSARGGLLRGEPAIYLPLGGNYIYLEAIIYIGILLQISKGNASPSSLYRSCSFRAQYVRRKRSSRHSTRLSTRMSTMRIFRTGRPACSAGPYRSLSSTLSNQAA